MILLNVSILKKILACALAVCIVALSPSTLYAQPGSTTLSQQRQQAVQNANQAQGQQSGLRTDIGAAADDLNFFSTTDEKRSLGAYISRAVDFGLIFGVIASLIFLIWGGIEWTTSGGDQQKYANARNKITYAIAGLAILALAFVIWIVLLYFLGFTNQSQLMLPLGNYQGAGRNLNTGGTGNTGGNGFSQTTLCRPYANCQDWQNQYVTEHPGATPPPIGSGNAWQEFVWSQETIYYEQNRGATREDWLNY